MNSLQLVAIHGLQTWASFALCAWSAVLLKDEARRQIRSATLNTFRQQGFNIKFSIQFGLVWNEMQSSHPTGTDARRNHDVLGELCSLSYESTFINVSLFTRRPNTIILMFHRRIQMEVFSSVKKTVIAFASGRRRMSFWQRRWCFYFTASEMTFAGTRGEMQTSRENHV